MDFFLKFHLQLLFRPLHIHTDINTGHIYLHEHMTQFQTVSSFEKCFQQVTDVKYDLFRSGLSVCCCLCFPVQNKKHYLHNRIQFFSCHLKYRVNEVKMVTSILYGCLGYFDTMTCVDCLCSFISEKTSGGSLIIELKQ